MKRVVLPVIVALFVLAGGEARADILLSNPLVQSGLACTPACLPGEFEWSYLAGVSQNETVSSQGLVPGAITTGIFSNLFKDYFTVDDFLGYIPGSEQHPVGWAFQSLLVGSTPFDVIPTDNPSVPNLTWYYTGALPIDGPAVLGVFSARSVFGSQALGNYVGSATNAGTARGTSDDKITQLITPTAVPEPASLLLFGTGLLGLVRVYRKRKQDPS